MLNTELLELIRNYTTDEIKEQLNNIFAFAEEYKNALENELQVRTQNAIKYNAQLFHKTNDAEQLNDELINSFNEGNENNANSVYNYVDDYSIESIDYKALQYIQKIVDNYKEYELVNFLQKYNKKRNSGLEPAIHYQAELCITKLQEMGNNNIVDEIFGEHEICKYCGSKIKRSSIFCEYCGEKTV